MRLLLCEDEHEMSAAVEAVLLRSNYSVDCVFNGEDALDYIETGLYDGVILDIMTPPASRSRCRRISSPKARC